jgi:hypothetical protein
VAAAGVISVIMAGQRERQPASDRNSSHTALPAVCADGARIGHDRRMGAAGGDAVIRLAHDETLMLFEIPHRREEQGRVTEPGHHAEQIALTRGYAWLAGQILLQDRHR